MFFLQFFLALIFNSILFQFAPSSSSLLAMELGEKLAAARSIPKELMNPVVRSQIRQRLRQLKLKNEAALRRRKLLFGDTQTEPSSIALGHFTSQQSNMPNNNNNQPTKELAKTNKLLPNNRNCFFSPINCQLPIPLISLRQRSIKRRIVGQSGAEFGPLFRREMSTEIRKEEGTNERESLSRIGKYIMAMTNLIKHNRQMENSRRRRQR